MLGECYMYIILILILNIDTYLGTYVLTLSICSVVVGSDFSERFFKFMKTL